MSVLKKMFENIPESFKLLVKTKYKKEFLDAIKTTIDAAGVPRLGVVPNATDTFNAFSCYDNVKIVILGQDPYPNKNAHGYAFSSLHQTPPSIKNIYKCLIHYKLIDKIPSHANLSSWASQGVLLLNAALTCTNGKSGTHMSQWKPFIEKVIEDLDRESIVFILLGNFAIDFGSSLIKAKVLTWGHPSPMSTVNQDEKNPKCFTYATVFNDANQYLISHDMDPINWNSINE